MRSTLFRALPPFRGLPRWALFASLPLVIVLGLVGGITLSIYWPPAAPPPTTPTVSTPEDGANPDASPDVTPKTDGGVNDPTDSGSLTPDQGLEGANRLLTDLLPRYFDEPLGHPGRATGYAGTGTLITPPEGAFPKSGPQEVKTLVDARTALTAEYGGYRSGGQSLFSVDYQVARDVNLHTMLIGIVRIADYSQWLHVVQDDPDGLMNWLQSAAKRVQPAAQKENFRLTWTIFETVSDPPYGFLAREVTPVPQGKGFVVTRPLAAVTDIEGSVVTLIAADSLSTRPTSGATPWNTYGPVIRFDPTDLYRPAPTSGTP